MARAIVITSGKGGVGKTTLTANLGLCLAKLGAKVAMMDTDIGLNNLDVLMEAENSVVYDLVDVIENRCRVKQALIQNQEEHNLYILPSAHGYDKSKITAQNIKAVINNLKCYFDYILVDCPAGIEAGFHRAVAACDEAIIVTTPHISSIRDAGKVINIVKTYRIEPQLVLNRARGDLIVTNEMLDVEGISNLLKLKPLGIIPEDDVVNLCSNLGVKSGSKSGGTEAFMILARNLHYGKNDLYDVTKKFRGLFGGLKRNLKKFV